MTTHGAFRTRAYKSWSGAKSRCFNQKLVDYPDYGGRGITMCDRWRNDFAAFLADMGPCPDGHSLDRIDVHGHYEHGNCRWASSTVQANNSRKNRRITFDNQTHTTSEWARIRGWQPGTLKQRLRYGWSIERALTEPLREW